MPDITEYLNIFQNSGSIKNFYIIEKNKPTPIPITASLREYNEEALSEILDEQYYEILPSIIGDSSSIQLQANFYATPVQGPPPFLVSFFDTSEGNNIIDWKWNLGSGTIIDNIQSPQYTYENVGNFHITLQVTGSDGQTSEITKNNYIMVSYDLPIEPTINWSADVRIGNAPLSVTFTDETIGPVISWFWYFHNEDLPNIEITSNQQNPIIEFIEPGHYHTTLKVTWHDEQGILHETSKEEEDYIIVSPSMVVPIPLYQLDLKKGGYIELLFGKENIFNNLFTSTVTDIIENNFNLTSLGINVPEEFSLEMLFKYETRSNLQPAPFPTLFDERVYQNYTVDFPFKVYNNGQTSGEFFNPTYPYVDQNGDNRFSFPITWKANRGFSIVIDDNGHPYIEIKFGDYLESNPNNQFILNDIQYINDHKIAKNTNNSLIIRDDINWNNLLYHQIATNYNKFIMNPGGDYSIANWISDNSNYSDYNFRLYSGMKCENDNWYWLCASFKLYESYTFKIFLTLKNLTNNEIDIKNYQEPNINEIISFPVGFPIGYSNSKSSHAFDHEHIAPSAYKPIITGADCPKISGGINNHFFGSMKYCRLYKGVYFDESDLYNRFSLINNYNPTIETNGFENAYGLWNMNDGDGTTIDDSSYYGFTMKLKPDPVTDESIKWDQINEEIIQ